MQGKQKKGVVLNTKNILILSTILVVISLGAVWFASALTAPFSWGYQSPGTATNYSRGGASHWLNFSVANTDGQFDTVYINHPVGNLNDHTQIIFEDSQVPDGTGSCSNDTTRLKCTTFTQLNGTTKVFSLKLKMNNTYNGKVNLSVEGWNGGTRVSATPNADSYFHMNFTIDSTSPVVNFSINDSRGRMSDSATNYLGWLTSGVEVACNATDSGAGPNTTFSIYYGTANSVWTLMNTSILVNGSTPYYFNYTNFNDSVFFVMCNMTDNVSNQGNMTKQFLGFDSIKPALASASASEGIFTSDYVFNSTYTPINLSVNVTDFFLLNVTLRCNVSGGTDILLTNATSETTVSNTTYANTTLNVTSNPLTTLCNLGANTEVPLNLTFIAYDNASNSEMASLTAYWDDLLPRVTNPTINQTTNITRTVTGNFNFTVVITDQNISTVYILNSTGGAAGQGLAAGQNLSLQRDGANPNLWFNYTNLSIFYGEYVSNNTVYTLRVNATDLAGNYNDSITLTITVDNTAPNVTGMIASRYVVNNNTNFTIQFSATDHVNENLVNLTNASSIVYDTLAGTTYTTQLTANTDVCSGFEGICAIRADVTDYAGNRNQTVFVNITVDNVAPTAAIVEIKNLSQQGTGFLNPTFQYIVNRSVNLTFSINASDFGANSTGRAVVRVNVTNNRNSESRLLSEDDSTMWQPDGNYSARYNGTTTIHSFCGFTTITESSCTLTFNATDNATNTVATSVVIWVDDRAPNVTSLGVKNASNIYGSMNDQINITVIIADQNLTGSEGGAATVGSVVIFNNSNGAVIGDMKFNGSGNMWYYDTTVKSFSGGNVDGTYTFKVNATDAAGNNNSISATVQLDAATPATTAVSTSPSIIKNTESLKVFANISAASNVTNAWVKFSGTDYEMTLSSTGPFVNANRTLAAATFSSLADGTYKVTVFGQSAGGTNQSAFAIANNATFTIDSTAITGTILQGMIDGVNATLQSVQANLSAVSGNVQQVNLTLQQVQSNVSAVSGNVQGLNSTVISIQSNVSAVSGNVQGLNSTIQAMQTNRTTDLAHIQQVNLTLQQVQANVSAVSGNVQGLNSTLQEVQSNVSAVSGNVQQVNLTLQQVQSNVSAVSGNVQGLNSTLSTNISQLFTHYAGLASANATLLGMINGLNSTLQSVQANLSAVSGNVQGLNSTMISIQSNVSAVSGNVQGLNSTIVQLQTNITNLNATVQYLGANITGLWNAVYALQVPTISTIYPSYQTFNTTTVWLNVTTLTAGTNCSYSTTDQSYDSMTLMNGNTTNVHNVQLTSLSDGLHVYFVRCTRITGGVSATATTSSIVIFNVDTSTTFAGLISNSLTSGQVKWRAFYLPTLALADISSLSNNYNISRVVNQSQYNYTIMYGYNSTSGLWQSYRPSNESLASLWTLGGVFEGSLYWFNMTNSNVTSVRII